jgi:hypothetical protein
MLLELGQGYGIRDDDQRLVASSVVMPYRPKFGWIGMVLVDEAMRRQKLATRLLGNAIAVLRDAGLVPMLDATPAGREVYIQLGFGEREPINRWRGTGAASTSGGGKEDRATAATDAGLALDEFAFGASRRLLLADFMARPEALTLSLPGGRGQLWSRAGRTATQIGPVVAHSAEDAVALCAMALDRIEGPVLLDVPDREASLAIMLSERGFNIERSFVRMGLGAPIPSTLGDAMRVIAGPELG